MSLSQEPVFSELKNKFICGARDIENEPYCGVSGRHAPDGKGIVTTNGAGPHNLQLFVLAPDGTVLHCLPGYWNPHDLSQELAFSMQLLQIWQDPRLAISEKKARFSRMQLAHVGKHGPEMVRRSQMQGFDKKFEAKNRPYQSDTVRDPAMAVQALRTNDNRLLKQAFKTTDQIMHERMAQRPFVPYEQFDVAYYTDYGRQKYEKHEEDRDMTGKLVNKPNQQNKKNKMKNMANRGVQVFNGGKRMRRQRVMSVSEY